jgi:hypothetical protein
MKHRPTVGCDGGRVPISASMPAASRPRAVAEHRGCATSSRHPAAPSTLPTSPTRPRRSGACNGAADRPITPPRPSAPAASPRRTTAISDLAAARLAGHAVPNKRYSFDQSRQVKNTGLGAAASRAPRAMRALGTACPSDIGLSRLGLVQVHKLREQLSDILRDALAPLTAHRRGQRTRGAMHASPSTEATYPRRRAARAPAAVSAFSRTTTRPFVQRRGRWRIRRIIPTLAARSRPRNADHVPQREPDPRSGSPSSDPGLWDLIGDRVGSPFTYSPCRHSTDTTAS